MIAVPSGVSTEAIEWAISSILGPELDELGRSGGISAPPGHTGIEEAIDSMTILFRSQLELLRRGRRQTIKALTTESRNFTSGAPFSSSKIHASLGSIVDWRGLIDDLRLRDSDHGRIPLGQSVITVKSAPWEASGSNVFPASSPAYPSEVEEELSRLGRLPATKARKNSAAVDSSIYLVETGPNGWTQVLRVEGMPEGTKWDPAEYDEDLRDLVAGALELQAGGAYTVSTDEILQGAVLSFFESVRDAGRGAEMPRPVESGWLSSGPRSQSFRFLGGELEMIRLLQKMGTEPFFDLPRTLVNRRAYPRARQLTRTPMLPTIPAADCSFEIDDGRQIPGVRLPWAAQVAFGSTPTKDTQGVFQRVDATTTAMGGADPDTVEYAVANAKVGKLGASKRFRAGLIVRNGPEGMSGWGVPSKDFRKQLRQREAIEQAERHVARMRPDGLFHRAVAYVQDLGVQTMGLTVSDHKLWRESLVLAADVLLARAHFHS